MSPIVSTLDNCSRLAWLLLIIAMFATAESSQNEINCLRSIKQSFQDPNNRLSTWQFDNNSGQRDNFTCSFTGVECWNNLGSNSVLNIRLSGMGLRGEFPRGIANCSTLTGLDLSNNHLYGSIPSDIAQLVPYLTYLNLSHNEISGEIPRGIANFSYISVLNLDNNRWTGGIPAEVVTLRRLTIFTVANNRLYGPVPRHPYSETQRSSFVNGFIVGWAVFCFLVFVGGFFVPFEMNMIRIKNMMWRIFPRHRPLPSDDGADNTMVSMLEKFCSRMSYHELSDATDNFNVEHVIASDETGTTYKAFLTNGWCLAIKRFYPYLHLEHDFLSEITTLGRIRHKNLVPLIGFCYKSNERLLVYKFMTNGSLHDCLFAPKDESKVMEWPLRLKIAVGIAEGIVCLHKYEVFHCRISSKSVFLDENFNPKISYMGNAANMVENRGYLTLGSYEEDVIGFGKVLIELITGKKYNEMGNSFQRIDGDMEQEIGDEISHLLRIAKKCLEWDQGKCPSMMEVYQWIISVDMVC